MKTSKMLRCLGLMIGMGFAGTMQAQGTFALEVGFQPANGMEITSVEGIKFTFGGNDAYAADQWKAAAAEGSLEGFTAKTEGNTQNPKDNEDKSYSADAQNVPTHGTYYVFEPQYDGTVTIAVRLNNNKNFFILEDGVPLEAYNGWKVDANISNTYDFKVKHGSKYYAFCTGSKMHFYGFKYETIGAQDPVTVLNNQLFDKVNNLLAMLDQGEYKDKQSVQDLIYEAEEIQLKLDENSVPADSAALAQAIEQVDKIRDQIFRLCELMQTLQQKGWDSVDIVEATGYPGQEAMMAAATAARDFDINQKGLTVESMEAEIEKLRQAYILYLCSQEKGEDGSIDVTGVILHPRFITDDGVYSYEGWKTNNSNIGDYGPRENAGRPCWNSYSDNFTRMDIHQQISGLPAGYYALRCSATTGNNQITTQHAYVTSSIGTAVSPVLTTAGRIDQGLWDTQETGRIYCPDGELTIGYASTGTLGQGATGWFCVSDFQLFYYGDLNDEEVAAQYEQTIGNAQAQLQTLHFGGDRSMLQAAIDEALKAKERAERLSVIATLETALLQTQQSESRYETLVGEGTLLAQVADELGKDDGAAYGAGRDIVRQVYDALMTFIANDATASDIDNINNRMEQALRDAKLTEVLTNHPETTDFTFLIQNADVQSLSGWSVVRTSSHADNSGEHFSGNPEYRYFDDWNATVGALNTHIRQQLTNVPNGTYTLKCAARTSGSEGAYIYAMNETETLLQLIELGTYTPEGGEPVEASNIYGPIWQEAVNAVNAGTATDEQKAQAEANYEMGYGWRWITIEGIKVTNHTLTIGLTTDSQITGKQFNGTWFSAGDFSLTLTAAGDNAEWIPTLGITTHPAPITQQPSPVLYNLHGQAVKLPSKGLYIINGKKILIK